MTTLKSLKFIIINFQNSKRLVLRQLLSQRPESFECRINNLEKNLGAIATLALDLWRLLQQSPSISIW